MKKSLTFKCLPYEYKYHSNVRNYDLWLVTSTEWCILWTISNSCIYTLSWIQLYTHHSRNVLKHIKTRKHTTSTDHECHQLFWQSLTPSSHFSVQQQILLCNKTGATPRSLTTETTPGVGTHLWTIKYEIKQKPRHTLGPGCRFCISVAVFITRESSSSFSGTISLIVKLFADASSIAEEEKKSVHKCTLQKISFSI